MIDVFLPPFFRAVDVENAIKLAAADDGFVTYEELRENLRKARFSDTEIDLFFYHFQVLLSLIFLRRLGIHYVL